MYDKNIFSVAPGKSRAPLNHHLPPVNRPLGGKIGRLPFDVREQLNHRLFNGQSGREILIWLNSLPAVRAVLNAQCNGIPVNAFNLTHWRQTGYQQWLRIRNAADTPAENAGDAPESTGQTATDALVNKAFQKVLEHLQTADLSRIKPTELFQCAGAALNLLKAQQSATRTHLAGQDLRLRELQLALQRLSQQLGHPNLSNFPLRPN
jgi:hypothetical protein